MSSSTDSQVFSKNLATGWQEPPGKSAKTRFGQINFINSLPLTLPLVGSRLYANLNVTLATPAKLNRMYFNNGLDVGAMSSFFFLEHGGFSLVPKVSIAGIGAVGSVLFFAKKAPDQLQDATLAVTHDSATSVNLLKVLFIETLGFLPQFQAQENPMPNDEYDGALVIGDRALQVDAEWSKMFHRIDLGKWWHDTFSLPMVFGVWAGRDEWIARERPAFEALCLELRRLFDQGLGIELPGVLSEAGRRTGLAEKRLRHYYKEELNFDLSSEHLTGLQHFASLCHKHGLLLQPISL